MWLIDKYRWADEDEYLAWTVAIIEGRTTEEVIKIYGGDPSQPQGAYSFNDAWVAEDDFGKYFHLQILEHKRYIIAIEPNGWTGKVPEIARRASADHCRFFSAYWNANGRWFIVQAANGKVSAAFDVVLQHDSDLIPDWARTVDVSTNQLGALCLALMEQQTGLAFDPAWLKQKLPTFQIPDPDVMLSHIPNARRP